MITQFPILYKANKGGAVMTWTIFVKAEQGSLPDAKTPDTFGRIVTLFGQKGGLIQRIEDLVTKGKNCGKKNETTAYFQAVAEAQARWEKQVKKGYVEDLEKAQRREDDIGGVLPMLAHRYDEHEDKITFPAYVQPKLDGIRCIAIVDNGKAHLFSRTRKPITGMPHIQRELEERFPHGRLVLDGELYNHALKSNFEQIVSLVRQENAAENHTDVQYHVYDLVLDESFQVRYALLVDLLLNRPSTQIVLVSTRWTDSKSDLLRMQSDFIEEGYEGAIVRNAHGTYENRRSYNLQKVKTFHDAEFQIVGVEEGRGKLVGHAIFKCITPPPEGNIFQVKLKGDLAKLKELFENPKLWQGKFLTVQFQGYSNKNRVPRFPVGLRIRENE